ncbi:hypothetical protein HanIR_Chr15g0775971 [Helianthus annuus]|nr:hypothetical protein HanIR_Chr15g0775971 [Helianthus annuus]
MAPGTSGGKPRPNRFSGPSFPTFFSLALFCLLSSLPQNSPFFEEKRATSMMSL